MEERNIFPKHTFFSLPWQKLHNMLNEYSIWMFGCSGNPFQVRAPRVCRAERKQIHVLHAKDCDIRLPKTRHADQKQEL